MASQRDPSFADMQLVRACKRGDKDAFNELVLKYQDRIFNTMMRLIGDHETACDLTQEAFLHAYRGLPRFQEASSFFTWLFRIAINLATSTRRQYMRKKKVIPFGRYARDEGDDERNWEPASNDQGPVQSLEEKERDQYIQEAIAAVEEPFRTALVLRDVEGMSYEEIQEILDCPIGTVRSRIHRARSLVKDKLQKFFSE